MAELAVYSYAGPGEQVAAETLAKELPADWLIVVGRELPTPQKDDVDLLVIGRHHIFVLEEKHWGPTVEVLNGGWLVKGALRPSPVGRNSQVARILAGLLKARVPGYAVAARSKHLVQESVVLSYPGVTLDTTGYPPDDDHILLLHDAPAALMEWDRLSTDFAAVRNAVCEFLAGLSTRKSAPESLGPFTVLHEVAGVGRSRVFWGEDSDREPVVLRAYPMDGWGPGVDAGQLVKNERQATKQIADMQRSWGVEATFVDEARRWVVLPIRPVASLSLKRRAAARDLAVTEGGRVTDRAAGIVLDAFEALAEVHATGVLHRGLSPDRVLTARGDRVMFCDFYLAHLPTDFTVAPALADTVDSSVPFRAPELGYAIGAATTRSDVYALALSLLWWVNGDIRLTDEGAVKALPAAVDPADPVLAVLVSCVADDPAGRPEAGDVVERLSALLRPPPPPNAPADEPKQDVFEPDGIVGGRYRIERKLGQGGFATSWLARVVDRDAWRVIKQFHDSTAVTQAMHEFEAAEKLVSPRCARVWDYSADPAYIVSDYVPGRTLKELGAEQSAGAEEYRRIVLDALDGLAYMHSEGHLHRDISPNNIVVTNEGRAVLIDFGLTTAKSEAVTIAGTLAFVAPEVLAAGPWSPAADLYALGVSVLRTMLGREPYRSHDKSELVPLSREEQERWGADGSAIVNALFRLVEADTSVRPSSAADFARYLKTVAATDVEPGERAQNPTVLSLRRLYRGSAVGNAGNRGLDDRFARETYVRTLLDTQLTPSVLRGELDVVLLTGNPGDGKTSFLSTLRRRLTDEGAVDVTEPTAAGWRMKLGDRTFAAVYDASEARDGKSSDQLLVEALEGGAEHTALVAINDGRLLNFFQAHADVYEDLYVAVDQYARGRPVQNSRVAVVDLKRRSIAPTGGGGSGLAGKVLDSFVADELWLACQPCRARGICPIFANRDILRGSGRGPLLELVAISHLRRKRRATFRDVRSAIAWTLTGDRSCDDVHKAIEEGRDLRLATDAFAFDLAFSAGNPDYLVAEWASVDPATLAAPGVERAMRSETLELYTPRRPGFETRQVFFGSTSTRALRDEVRAYRFFDEFVDALNGDLDGSVKETVLLGLSRVLGAHGYQGSALALRDGESDGWSVLREIPAEEFTLVALEPDGRFVESQPEGLRLSHRLGSIVLTLDSYELIRRAADGEILGDSGAEAVKLELASFGNVLRTTPAHRVVVVDPSGGSDLVRNVGGVLTREGADS
ncbi:protein kinase [Cellulomonas sp. zg-ZUI199]|uniref:non-specific serine/threonine protein kinase n=1 Tax=Cellulomonas wangleii TaxID=2816956 RepID=A0ABX8D5H3_9CELL|nr:MULTISPECIES: protein kinase [Cellulomonas]MBO0898941.1 protein kinase [Cellulomonas sp. zg-ZUI22]MBO0923772.1 protein kinase [Cellulomonas wangleii]MBO0924054.1 protein kinase [Cellulomonas wangleii]QVI62080.1 protein kinase [Cellulomonas wangleii]